MLYHASGHRPCSLSDGDYSWFASGENRAYL